MFRFEAEIVDNRKLLRSFTTKKPGIRDTRTEFMNGSDVRFSRVVYIHFCGVEVETVYQQSMRGHIIKSLMGFNGVIEIDKAVQGSLAMSAAGKHLSANAVYCC